MKKKLDDRVIPQAAGKKTSQAEVPDRARASDRG
jgi:hypothetical protein